MYPRKRSASSISGAYKSAAFKVPRALAPLRRGGWANPSGGGGRGMSLPNQSELKFNDVTTSINMAIGATTWTTPGAGTLLNGLIPNSTATGRIGRRVIMKSLYLRLTAQLQAATVGGGPVRMLIVYDKQSNAAAPGVLEVLTTNEFVSMNNISNRDRFVTLCDQVTEPVTVGGQFQVSATVYKKLNLGVQFNAGAAGTIGDITSGAVYVLFAQGGGATVAAQQVTFYSRIRYTDN